MKFIFFVIALFLFAFIPASAQDKDGDIGKAKKHLVNLLDHLLEKGDSDAEKYLNAIRSDFPDDFAFRGIARKVAEMKEKARAAEDKKRKNLVSLRELTTDIPSYIEKEITVNGAVSLSTYYNYGYGEAEVTHYAFRIREGRSDINVYATKDEFGQGLRKQLLKAEGGLRGSFKIVILRRRYEASGDVFAELLGYGPEVK